MSKELSVLLMISKFSRDGSWPDLKYASKVFGYFHYKLISSVTWFDVFIKSSSDTDNRHTSHNFILTGIDCTSPVSPLFPGGPGGPGLPGGPFKPGSPALPISPFIPGQPGGPGGPTGPGSPGAPVGENEID